MNLPHLLTEVAAELALFAALGFLLFVITFIVLAFARLLLREAKI